jgi:hypothetical protein
MARGRHDTYLRFIVGDFVIAARSRDTRNHFGEDFQKCPRVCLTMAAGVHTSHAPDRTRARIPMKLPNDAGRGGRGGTEAAVNTANKRVPDSAPG